MNSGKYFGEADFKIAEYIKANEALLVNRNIAIVSMDNDLLFLALKSKIQNICAIMPAFDANRNQFTMRVISIPEIRKRLNEYIKKNVEGNEFIFTEFYQDLILLEIIKDNSYLPPLYDEGSSSLNNLVDSYFDYRKHNASLIQDGKIKWDRFIQYLGLLNEKYPPRKYSRRKEEASPMMKKEIEQFLKKIDCVELLKDYDHTLLCKYVEFIEGLDYSVQTYFGGKVHLEWSYHFYDAPTIEEIIKLSHIKGGLKYSLIIEFINEN